MNDVVSVIIPVYNAENVLRRTLNTVAGQTYKNLDVILVDDGSTDGSRAICDEYVKNDSRFSTYHIKNNGVANARNYGVRMSRGGYITFVDADDMISLHLVEELMNTAKQYKSELVTCHSLDFRYDENINVDNISDEKLNVDVAKKISYEQYEYLSDHSHYTCWGVLYAEKIAKAVEFDPSLYVGEDTLYFFQCLKLAGMVTDINIPLYYHIHYEESLSHGNYDRRKYTEITTWKHMEKLSEDNILLNETVRAALAQRCYYGYKRCRKGNNMLEGELYNDMIMTLRKNMKHAIKHHNRMGRKELIAMLCVCAAPEIYARVRRWC